ncbi:MAG: hypothetical protein RL095_1209 [Verrucomicrobiota bacterium]|jgi:thiol-disulfide isomerase/thioredoxin
MFASSILAFCLASASQPVLKPGREAPSLDGVIWLTGDAAAPQLKGRISVVDLWATWCGPCLAGMPHLLDLQRRHGDKIQIIAIDILERDEARVKKFLAENPAAEPLRQLRTGFDAQQRIARDWFSAAGFHAIPVCFLVDAQGKIAWCGPSGDLDERLDFLLAGRDFAGLERQLTEWELQHPSIQKALKEKNLETAAKGIAAIRQAAPDLARRIFPLELELLVLQGQAEGLRRLVEEARQKQWLNNSLALQLAVAQLQQTSEGLDLAIDLMRDAAGKMPVWVHHYGLAKLLIQKGDKAGAREAFLLAREVLRCDAAMKPASREGRIRELDQILLELTPAEPKP